MKTSLSSPLPPILTLQEAADYLRVNYHTMRDFIHLHGLKTIRVKPKGPIKIRLETLDKWLAKRES